MQLSRLERLILILLSSITLNAASCNSVGSGARGVTAKPKARAPSNWSIGILKGDRIDTLADMPGCANPRFGPRDIPWPASEFVADPFLLQRAGRWYMFFESFNAARQKGEIGLAISRDLCNWSYAGTVLSADTHLSFPFVFQHAGEFYMVPESRQAGVIELFRAQRFPDRWKAERILVRGSYSDATLVEFKGRWWIFANRHPYGLAIFSAPTLADNFTEHPLSPTYLEDESRARPAGRPVVINGTLHRFVQDNREGYGRRVRVLRVVQLDTGSFGEEIVEPDPLLTGAGDGWNGYGMHHISAVQQPDNSWVAAVDGSAFTPLAKGTFEQRP